MPSLENINNFFTQSVNQFVEPIYNWIWRTNPFISLIPRAEFSPMDGLIPKVVTTTSELPTEYPDWGNLSLSDGTGNEACNVEPTEIVDGTIERNYQLEITAFVSRTLCLTDLQFDWQAEQEVANLQANLRQYATVTWSDWYRIKTLCMCQNKISTEAAGAFNQDTNGDCDFSTFTGGELPSADLSWDHLNYLYDILMQAGGEANAVGYSEGQPLVALVCGPGVKRNLWQDDEQVRDTVNWGDAFQNFTARGINTSINGYVPSVDLYPLRFAADGVTKIYPTTNTAATKGRKSIPNPNYKTVARGGLAVYEAAYILPRDVWEARFRPVGTTSYGMAGFNPISYVGDLQWINNKDNVDNPQGNKGYYRLDMQAAARPVRPEIGYAIMTQAVD